MLRILGESEFECDVWHFHVFLLRKLVFQSRQELGVHLVSETLNIVNSCLQIFFLVLGHLLHFLVPCVDSFDSFGRQYQTCGGNFRWSILEQACIEHWDFDQVLSKEEHLVVWCCVANFPESLQKSQSWWACYTEVQSRKNHGFHFENVLLREFIFWNIEQIFEVGWINFLVFGWNEQRCDAQEVELRLFDLFAWQELVNNVACHVESFR